MYPLEPYSDYKKYIYLKKVICMYFLNKQQPATLAALTEANDDPAETAEDSKLLANNSAHSRQESLSKKCPSFAQLPG